jgi:hypothetical protein
MMRNVIIGCALLALAFCLVGAASEPGLWPMAIPLTILVAALLFERNRYQERLAVPPRDRLQSTDERFIDPESGRPVRVWLDPAGRRFYLDEADGAR